MENYRATFITGYGWTMLCQSLVPAVGVYELLV